MRRRSFLKRTAAVGGGLVAATGGAAGSHTEYWDPITLRVWFSGPAPTDHFDDYLLPAIGEIESQIGVPVEIEYRRNTSTSYSGGYGDVMDQFRQNMGTALSTNAINLLFYSNTPGINFGNLTGGKLVDLPAPAVHHNGEYPTNGQPPVAVVNSFVSTMGMTYYLNTILTAILRPILFANRDKAPAAGDVNSFGTIYRGSKDKSSPMATWHVPSQCPDANLASSLANSNDLVSSLCGAERVKTCGASTELSACTRAAVAVQLGDLDIVDGNIPTDPDEDGLHEDLTGNGRKDVADAVQLFQNRDDPAVTADAFDFSGNGGIDIADTVDLFQENTN